LFLLWAKNHQNGYTEKRKKEKKKKVKILLQIPFKTKLPKFGFAF
jgi:hypothetical protein